MDNFKQIDVENLLNKIDKFYISFYVSRLLKGVLTSFGVVLGVFLLFNFVFYYVAVGDIGRFILFYSLILIFLSSLYFWIIIPIAKLLRFSKGLSPEEASRYIGSYYKEIGDSLLNVVQVNKLGDSNVLAKAAVIQQSNKYKEYKFEKAVPALKEDKKIFLILIPISFFILLFFSNSKVLTEGSNRIYNYEVDFSKIAPFDFIVENEVITIFEGSNVHLNVNLKGDNIPNNLNLNLEGIEYGIVGENGFFAFELKNVTVSSVYFYSSGQFASKQYEIIVVKRPRVMKMVASVKSLNYYGLDLETFENPTILNVMEGSSISWFLDVDNVEEISFYWNGVNISTGKAQQKNGVMTIADFSGQFEVYGQDFFGETSLLFQSDVFVQKDQFPDIKVKETVVDSIHTYSGIVVDDFGFKELRVFISVGDSSFSENISINDKQLNNSFSYRMDMSILKEDAMVWFTVRDNDSINGFKSKSSIKFDINVMSKLERIEKLKSDGKAIKEKLNNILKDNEQLSEEFENIKKVILNKKELSWAETKRMRSAIQKQKDVNADLQKLQKDVKKFNSDQNLKKEPSSQMIEKQKQLEDLMDKLLNEENKELLKELQKMMDNLDRNKLQEQLKDIERSQENLNQELERDLEIFKQMEVEQKMEDVVSTLEDIKKKQEELLTENVENENSLEDVSKDQEILNKEFEQLKEDMNDLDSLNKELKEPNELDLDKEKQEEVSKKMEEAAKESKEGKRKDSQESQQDALDKMEELQDKMEESLSMNSSSQEGEDLESLRKILENLLVLSFDEEANMEAMTKLDRSDPLIVELTQDQLKIYNNSQMVKDSLYALSVRVPQIKSHITDELVLLEENMDNAMLELKERKLNQASLYQHKSLTSINNLAVLLDEIIQQLQEQQKKKNKGTGSCSKPGEGKPKPSLGKSKKKQEELAKQMKAMKKEMEKGKMPGKMNPGSAGKGMSKEVAKLALQQGQIRSEIRKMRDELQKQGDLKGAGELKKLEQLLDKNEEDIVNFNLDNEFFNRQKEIEVKLLEAENAAREREKEKRREANTADNIPQANNVELEEYLKLKQNELELLRLANPKFSNYYKNKVGQFNLLE
jgi:hypothetical protein